MKDPGSVEVWRLENLWQVICFSLATEGRREGGGEGVGDYRFMKNLNVASFFYTCKLKKILILPMLFFFLEGGEKQLEQTLNTAMKSCSNDLDVLSPHYITFIQIDR